MQLKEILLLHSKMYPKMQAQDVIKLLYQNEFGGGHLIADENLSLLRLKNELENTPTNPALPLFVPIGNGLVRVNLCALTEHRISPEELNSAFVRSANLIKGTKKSLRNKINSFCEWIKMENPFEFSASEFEQFAAEYEKSDFPIISHSSCYREYYAPAYRVIIEKMLKNKEK